MKKGTAIGLGAGALVLGALGLYVKRQVDMIYYDVYYDYDKSSVKIKKIGVEDTQFTMDYIIDNRGDLAVDVKDVRVKVKVGKKTITDIVRFGEFKIQPKMKVPININVSLNPKMLIKEVFPNVNILKWKEIPLTFVGSVRVKKMGIWLPIPFKFTYAIGEFI